ncbi:MAG TPA: hypothetical protein VFJ16_02680 [Longimicrobium sp.]|nr:hypothetical protein [Longimicrobium sp.]
MPLLLAIPFSILLIMLAGSLSVAIEAPALPALVVIATALWVYFDAKKLDLARYRTGLINPEVVTIGCFLMWIVAFPWYLSARHKIKLGQMPLKNPPPPNESPWG